MFYNNGLFKFMNGIDKKQQVESRLKPATPRAEA